MTARNTSALLLLVPLSIVLACGSSATTPTEPDPPVNEPPSPEEPVEPTPEPALPEVWGVQALVDRNPDPKIVEVDLEASATTLEVGGHTLSMLGYNGQIPGPLVRARAGDELIVHFHNGLDQPTTIHWHGLRIPDDMDGSPRVREPVAPGADFTYRFVIPEAGSYWYHPHVRAHEQVEAGLYAPLVVWDERDPSYDLERYLVLDDLLVDGDGTRPPPFQNQQEYMFGRYGNVALQNGQTEPLRGEASQGQIERWRIVNVANARTQQLKLVGAKFRVIGTDGGLLPEPYEARSLLIAVGQRFDLEVVFDQPGPVQLLQEFEGESLTVLEVEVAASDRAPRSIAWPSIVHPDRSADTSTSIVFDAVNGDNGIEWRLNGQSHPDEPLFVYPEGHTVDITLDNTIGPEHPFHLHGQFFQVLDDRKQVGLKDTVLVPGFTKVKIRAFLDNPGRWMAHCHILEHAQIGMMADMVITPKDGSAVPEPLPGHEH